MQNKDNETKPENQAPAQDKAETKPEGETQEGEAGADGKPTKSQLKKLEKEAKKAAQKAANAQKVQQSQQAAQSAEDPLKDNYGEYDLMNDPTRTDRVWTPVHEIDDSLVGKDILVRARIHSSRVKGNLAFLVLRQRHSDVQVVAAVKADKISKQMIKFIDGIPRESIVDIYAEVVKPLQEIQSCSQKMELSLKKVFVVSRSEPLLPFQLEDASRKVDLEAEDEDYDTPKTQATEQKSDVKEEEKEQQIVVGLKTRLDNRVIDLRTKANQAIFRLESGVCQLFREFLYTQDFIEVMCPKLTAGTSEGGANVFTLKYFGNEACLAQSPQLYKQMCIMGDFDRVFTIGPVFRAENSFTARHMCEFTGLDFEMAIKESYLEIMDVIGDLFSYIFENLEKRFAREIEAIREQYPFEPFKNKKPCVKLTFQEGVDLLKENGIIINPLEDLDTPTEKKLGEIVRKKYETDFYILHRYPEAARPFYTMLAKDDSRYTNSYDVFMRGQEIISGAQRIHEPKTLAERAVAKGIKVETITDYVDSFKYGAYPHGGIGVGLERVVMLYCNLGNIRRSSMFPRDPKRLTP